jgi:hypothetical protein
VNVHAFRSVGESRMSSHRRARTLAAKLRKQGWDVEVWPAWNTGRDKLELSWWAVLWEGDRILRQRLAATGLDTPDKVENAHLRRRA